MKTLASLIEAHGAAWRAFCEAIDRVESAETPSTKQAWRVTDKAEKKAALAVCAYRCRTIEEARIKAEYLLGGLGLFDQWDECETALLQSFLDKRAA
jgi:hypothetical protein